MNGEDRNELSVLRAEVNGRLDTLHADMSGKLTLLLERTQDQKQAFDDHEKLERHPGGASAEAVEAVQKKLWMAAGAATVIVLAANIALAAGWFG